MADPSEENIIVAKTLMRVLGGKSSVHEWWDEGETTSVDLLTCEGAPQKGVNSYATVNLSDHPIMFDGEEYPARAEILGACAADVEDFANVISTCAFNVIKDKWPIAPGIIHPDVVEMYDLSETMKHVIFFPPFLWDDKLKTLELKTRTVAFLLAVPISDAERDYSDEFGSDALETLFEEHQIDIFDINRPSVA